MKILVTLHRERHSLMVAIPASDRADIRDKVTALFRRGVHQAFVVIENALYLVLPSGDASDPLSILTL